MKWATLTSWGVSPKGLAILAVSSVLIWGSVIIEARTIFQSQSYELEDWFPRVAYTWFAVWNPNRLEYRATANLVANHQLRAEDLVPDANLPDSLRPLLTPLQDKYLKRGVLAGRIVRLADVTAQPEVRAAPQLLVNFKLPVPTSALKWLQPNTEVTIKPASGGEEVVATVIASGLGKVEKTKSAPAAGTGFQASDPTIKGGEQAQSGGAAPAGPQAQGKPAADNPNLGQVENTRRNELPKKRK